MLKVGNILEMQITDLSVVWNSKDLGEIKCNGQCTRKKKNSSYNNDMNLFIGAFKEVVHTM